MLLSPRARLSLSSLSSSFALVLALTAHTASAQEPLPTLPPPAPTSAPADTPAPPLPPPVAQTPAPAPPPAPIAPAPLLVAAAKPAPGQSPDDVRFVDAHADRVILGSTAETHPAGTFFFSDYEIALLQIGYAVTDDVQVSLSGVPPIFQNQPFFVDLGLKVNLVRTDGFRAAVTGALEVATTGGSGNSTNVAYPGGRMAAIGQFCFNDTCRSSLSLNVGAILSTGFSGEVPIYGSTGFIWNVSSLVSLMAEPAAIGTVNAGGNSATLFAFDYGLRIAQKNFGVDLTFVEPVATTSGSIDNPLILGFPFVAFTYRTDGSARGPAAQGASNVANAVGLVRGN